MGSIKTLLILLALATLIAAPASAARMHASRMHTAHARRAYPHYHRAYQHGYRSRYGHRYGGWNRMGNAAMGYYGAGMANPMSAGYPNGGFY